MAKAKKSSRTVPKRPARKTPKTKPSDRTHKRAPAKKTSRKPPAPKKKPIKEPGEALPPSPPSALEKEPASGMMVAPPLYPKEPAPPPAPGMSSEITLDLDALPPWEDRLRLRRTIFEDGLKFYLGGKGSPDAEAASKLLSECGKDSQDKKPGHFIVFAKDRAGKVVAAMDGHALDKKVLSICRSSARDRRVRDMHVLLYAAALTGRGASYVVFSTAICPFSYELAGKMVVLGRGFGMSAVPLKAQESMLFIRKKGSELEHSLSGGELADVIRSMVILQPSLAQTAGDFAEEESVHLIPLPLSPDSREHLHELRDAVESMQLSGETKDVFETIRNDYVIARKDITPEKLF